MAPGATGAKSWRWRGAEWGGGRWKRTAPGLRWDASAAAARATRDVGVRGWGDRAENLCLSLGSGVQLHRQKQDGDKINSSRHGSQRTQPALRPHRLAITCHHPEDGRQ